MVKYIQTIRLLPTNCLSVFDHFVELSLKGLNSNLKIYFDCFTDALGIIFYFKTILQLAIDQCSHHIETSQLICGANQLTGFYMMGTLVDKGLRLFTVICFLLIFTFYIQTRKKFCQQNRIKLKSKSTSQHGIVKHYVLNLF